MNDALKRVLSKNLADNHKTTKEGNIKLTPGSLLDVALYIAENLLPKIEFRNGADSHDYKQLFLAVNACLLCVELLDVNEHLKQNDYVQRNLLKWTQEQCMKYERELQRFLTVKELIERDSLEDFKAIVLGEKIDYIKQSIKVLEARNKLGI